MFSVMPRIDSTWQQVGDHHLERALLAFRLRNREIGDLFGVRGAEHLVEDLAHVRRLRPEHIVETLSGELAGRHA